ncbi:hypothetical protein HYH02_000371 [Chlamydomonas schloesseri]|uniref:Glycosyltransferase 2-like domain-containing protein n=1 Tax=Chlamydomonas schloesseri TaxID=2026947 RepID=A0A836BD90_9CHLO|nr:hypothetical protein HYH02_000371 [Chlamydomonas schloesseri]|eukprot:KAG2454524.1 hypothetical protein HYH02_000371 [Chlamydomonas schloesseri]
MQALLGNLRNPPKDAEHQHAWKTNMNYSEVNARFMGSQLQRNALEDKMKALVTHLRAAGQLAPATTVQELVHCCSGHLNPALYPDRPQLSLMLQYWRRPVVIPYMESLIAACNQQVRSELVVNVDDVESPADVEAWGELAWRSQGLVVPVLSANVHEARAINRMAGVARGRVLVVLQDDDTLAPADCSWALPLLKQFEAMPKLGMVGLKGYRRGATLGNKERWSDTFRLFSDPGTGAHFTFPLHTDYAPVAFRRSALRNVGGVDEGMSDPGECGIVSDWELSVRMWAAGWHVGFMPLLEKQRINNEEGSTHRPDVVRRCWARQQDLGRRVYNARWGTGFNAGIGQFLEALENDIRILNLKTLAKNYTECPFRKGCDDLVGNPALPAAQADEFRRVGDPMVLDA